MIPQKINALYFSPTGNTKSVVKSMISGFNVQWDEIDLTPYENRDTVYSFDADELVFVGTPVYGGHIPIVAENRIKLLKGNNTPIVLVVTYGGIHYSNALYELQQIVSPNGFTTIGAAAVVAEHNVVGKIASGRPNIQELTAISAFSNRVFSKTLQTNNLKNVFIKRNMPISLRNKYPAVPYGNKKCINCGVCAKQCPVKAIDNPRKKAYQACIRCMRCIKYCPRNARTFSKMIMVGVRLLLSFTSRSVENQPAFFL